MYNTLSHRYYVYVRKSTKLSHFVRHRTAENFFRGTLDIYDFFRSLYLKLRKNNVEQVKKFCEMVLFPKNNF